MIILPTGKARPFRPNAIPAIIAEMLVNLKNQFVSPGGVGFPNGRSFVRYVDFACPSGYAKVIDRAVFGRYGIYAKDSNGAGRVYSKDITNTLRQKGLRISNYTGLNLQ